MVIKELDEERTKKDFVTLYVMTLYAYLFKPVMRSGERTKSNVIFSRCINFSSKTVAKLKNKNGRILG